MTDHNLRLIPLVLAALGFCWSPLGAGVANASVWTGRATHFASPSDAHWTSSGPMRAPGRTSPHAVSFVSPNQGRVGIVRAPHGMPSHLLHARAPLVMPEPFRSQRGTLVGAGTLPEPGTREEARQEHHHFVYIAEAGPGGLHGWRRDHTSTHPPTHAPVRWPVGTGAHPVARYHPAVAAVSSGGLDPADGGASGRPAMEIPGTPAMLGGRSGGASLGGRLRKRRPMECTCMLSQSKQEGRLSKRRSILERLSLPAGAVGCIAVASSCALWQAQKKDGDTVQVKAPAPSEPNPQIEISPVQDQDVSKVLVTSARIAWDENRVAHIFPPVTGRVIDIRAQLGDRVKKGQPLATILSPDIGSAVSDMAKAKAALVAAEHDVKRQRELFALHAVSAATLEASEDNYGVCVAEMQRAEQKAALLREAGTNAVTQTFQLYSPIDGQVLARAINPGIEVQGMYSGGSTQELYTVGSADALWVLADVYEQDMGRVKVGASVEVRTVAYPDKPIPGNLDWISDTLDPVMRTITVRCTLQNLDHLLKPQMYATVSIQTEGRRTLAIARSSVLHFGEKTMVVAADTVADKFERKPVIVDENETGDWVPVLHGVEAGEKVVTRGALILSEAIK